MGSQQSGVSGSISRVTGTARLITFELQARSARMLTASHRFGRVVGSSAMAMSVPPRRPLPPLLVML